MANPWRSCMRFLHDWAHRPDELAYQHRQRAWMVDRVFAAMGGMRVGTLVEVGCGDGWVSHELTRHADRVVGFDMNPHRIEPPRRPGLLLVAGEAERPPLREGCGDLLISIAVLEHLVDRAGALRGQAALVKPGGLIVQIVPTAPMKVMQWLGFYPHWARKQVRGVTRSLAGRRTPREQKPAKFYEGRETNNPHRRSRRRWWQKLYPRVHGEYDTNWQEYLHNRDAAWRAVFAEAGFEVTHNVRLGLYSPYFFGFAWLARVASRVGLASVRGYVLTRSGSGPIDVDGAAGDRG